MAVPLKADPRSVSPVDRQIGNRMRARRLEIGMSQELLAHRIGVTFQQVQKYEKGINRVSARTLLAIAEALEVPMSDLMPSQAGRASSVIDDPDLWVSFSQLNGEGQDVLRTLARSLANDAKYKSKK